VFEIEALCEIELPAADDRSDSYVVLKGEPQFGRCNRPYAASEP
jgi:hypothetical protein